eukprot:UN10941
MEGGDDGGVWDMIYVYKCAHVSMYNMIQEICISCFLYFFMAIVVVS